MNREPVPIMGWGPVPIMVWEPAMMMRAYIHC